MRESTKQSMLAYVPRSRFLYKLAMNYVRHYSGYIYGNLAKNGELAYANRALSGIAAPIVFDIGANVGKWSQEIRKISPSARLYAFEPVPETFVRLQSRLGSDDNVCINQKALGANSGKITVYEYDISAVSSIYPLQDRPAKRTHEVEVLRLDDYCVQNAIESIDFLKIDAEGHDFYVLQGAERLLKKQVIKAVQFEYGPPNIGSRVFMKDCFEYAACMGYGMYRVYPNYLLEVSTYTTELENFISTNYALLPSKERNVYSNYIKSYDYL